MNKHILKQKKRFEVIILAWRKLQLVRTEQRIATVMKTNVRPFAKYISKTADQVCKYTEKRVGVSDD